MKMTSMARMGSSGNTKLLGKYGGKHKDRPYKFANGGAVPGATGPREAYADGGPIDGIPARARLDRPGKKGKDKKGGHTTVNVVVAGKGGSDGAPAMPMPPPGAGPGGPPMPPPGPMPPMRKDGGRVDGDEAQDKKMTAGMVHKHEKILHKGSKLTKFRRGGKIKSRDWDGDEGKYAKGGRITMTAGACSGEGREEKSEAVEKRFGKK